MNVLCQLRQTGPRWLGACLFLSAAVLAAPPISSLTETVLKEPVFHGTAHVMIAGPEAAPTVVLVHGIGDSAARDWDGLITVLARRYRVVAFDLPGFGRSSKGNEPYTPENYVAFLRYLMAEHIRAPSYSLIGHSMGGAIALRYAARYPQDVTALVLVDVPGILHRLAYSKSLSDQSVYSLPSLYRAQNDHLSNLMSNILGVVEKIQPAPETIVASPKWRQSLLNAEPAKIAGLALALEDFSADIPRVQAPVLVLWGGRDAIAPLRTGKVLSANLPRAQLEVFETSGHTPMHDVPEQFNTRIAAFLDAPVPEQRNRILQRERMQPVSARIGTCKGQRGVVFEGDYDRINIYRCRDALVRAARVRELRIRDAAVDIEDSLIGGVDGGLSVDNARVNITSSRIEARIAITAVASRLDIAGSRIVGEEAALVAPLKSEVLFSVSQVRSPHFRGSLHELRVILPGSPL